MNNLPDIKNRMKVISDIGKVTGAMETVSIAKMSKALSAFRQNEPYFSKYSSVMSDVVARTKYSMQRYFSKCRGNRAVFLVIGSDKGLVGSFNHDLLKYACNKFCADNRSQLILKYACIAGLCRSQVITRSAPAASINCAINLAVTGTRGWSFLSDLE